MMISTRFVVEAGWHPDMGKMTKESNPYYSVYRQLLGDLQVYP
jgi:hypothetical protein